MHDAFSFHLLKSNMHAPVHLNVRLDGAPTGQPGVTAVGVRTSSGGWCLLADHPANPGASVTNAAESYAAAVCNSLGCAVDALKWFELDSEGNIDVVTMSGASACFAPLHEAGCAPCSRAAFLARIEQLPGGMPAEVKARFEECYARFAKPVH